jgi:hypothetical protein
MQPGPILTSAALADLHFDPDNPRLPERLKHAPDIEVLEYLLLECNLIELMLSIGQQDFFVGEPLLVVPRAQGGLTVVEGNRRLGALRLLQHNARAPVMPNQVAQARDEAHYHPTAIPVLSFEQRDQILSYLGYRHITGIKEWHLLAKARYLHQLRSRHEDNHIAAHKALAREIGSKAAHVAKLLTGLTLLAHARDTGLLNRLKMQEDDIPFSLLTTGIGYDNICRFIGLGSSGDVEALGLREREFAEFFTWVFDRSGYGSVLGESRNFDKLARVVANEQALTRLRAGASLDNADMYTSGPLEAVRKLMFEAERQINAVQNGLSFAEGLDASDVATADRIRRAANALSGAVQQLVNPQD